MYTASISLSERSFSYEPYAFGIPSLSDSALAFCKFLEAIAVKSTVVMMGEVSATAARVAVENDTAWTAADMQAAIQALGATVGADSVDLRGTTVAAFTY